MHSSLCAIARSHSYGESDPEDDRLDGDASEEADEAEVWWSITEQARSAEYRTDTDWWQEVTELMDHEGFEDAAATGVNHTQLDQGASTDARCDDEWPF